MLFYCRFLLCGVAFCVAAEDNQVNEFSYLMPEDEDNFSNFTSNFTYPQPISVQFHEANRQSSVVIVGGGGHGGGGGQDGDGGPDNRGGSPLHNWMFWSRSAPNVEQFDSYKEEQLQVSPCAHCT